MEENVSLPLELCGHLNPKLIRQQVDQMLDKVGMSNRANFYPAELSGGEMQRTAIARALINNPKLLVADEPTGNLDSANGEAILKLLKSFSIEKKQTIIMATHSLEAERFADRIIEMKDGTIIGERRQCSAGLKLFQRFYTKRRTKKLAAHPPDHNWYRPRSSRSSGY